MPRIVVVSEDDAIGGALVDVLSLDGYTAERSDPPTARRALESGTVQLLVVDLDPAVGAGDGLGPVARSAGAVVLALAEGRDTADAARRAQRAGADEWVRKPFALADVRARVRSQLRRDVVTTQRIVVGDIEMDRVTRRVWRRGREVEMRPKEFDLLALLLEHAGRAVSRQRIIREVWDARATRITKSLDVHVSSLRRKLADTGATRIVTVRGVGYRYDPQPPAPEGAVGAIRSVSPPEGVPPSSRPSRA